MVDGDRLSDYDFQLPDELIAQRPASEREASRLLVLPRREGEVRDRMFAELPTMVTGDELFIVNNTKVVPARLRGHKPTGGAVELLALEPAGEGDAFIGLARSSKPVREGSTLSIRGEDLVVEQALGHGRFRFKLPPRQELWSWLEAHGELPLPPYIARPDGPSASDRVRYQTVFARHPGAVAAPTAGLHFTPGLFDALRARGCDVAEVTLHVGIGTFQPIRADALDNHEMHSERYEVSSAAASKINAARRAGRPVVAVGTTVVRTLESVVDGNGVVASGAGATTLFIRNGHAFRAVDQLITNFHLPRSSLLVMVGALVGRQRLLRTYAHAVAERYRFYSYGDAMWIR